MFCYVSRCRLAYDLWMRVSIKRCVGTWPCRSGRRTPWHACTRKARPLWVGCCNWEACDENLWDGVWKAILVILVHAMAWSQLIRHCPLIRDNIHLLFTTTDRHIGNIIYIYIYIQNNNISKRKKRRQEAILICHILSVPGSVGVNGHKLSGSSTMFDGCATYNMHR